MPAVSQVTLCNRALGRIKAGKITSIDEQSVSAENCRLYYPAVMENLLEGDHDWSFATVRAALAQLVTNDRSGEWMYAYQLPSNMASGSAIRILPNFDGLGLGVPIPLPGEPYAEAWSISARYLEMPYEIAGTTLYTNTEDATLEYTLNDIAGISVPSKLITAMELDLASRLAVPIKNDKDREASLQAAAQVEYERAIADDRNRQPQHTGEYISETILARQGYMPEVP